MRLKAKELIFLFVVIFSNVFIGGIVIDFVGWFKVDYFELFIFALIMLLLLSPIMTLSYVAITAMNDITNTNDKIRNKTST